MDAQANFAVGTVLVAPSPATNGTVLTLATGHGARMPAVPFNAALSPPSAAADPTNSEIVRVTALVGDVATIVRTQESTSARAILVGDRFAATITKKTFDDLVATIVTKGVLNTGDTPPSTGIWLVRPLPATTTVNSDLDARWAVRSRINSDLDARWVVVSSITSVNADLDLRWKVLSSVPTPLKKWTGDSIGGTDSTFSVQAANLTSDATGPRSPRLKMVAGASTASVTNWGAIGSLTSWTFAFDFECAALPGSLAQFFVPFTAASGTALRLQMTSLGVVQLCDASATVRASSPSLSAATGYRFEGYGNTNGMTVDIYLQGTSSLVASLTYSATSAFGANFNNFRFGLISGIAAGWTAYFDSIYLASGIQPVGDWVTAI